MLNETPLHHEAGSKPATSTSTVSAGVQVPTASAGGNAVSSLRFAAWIGMVTFGVLAIYFERFPLGTLALGLSPPILMPRRQLTTPLSKSKAALYVFGTVATLAGLFAVGDWIYKSPHLAAARTAAGDALELVFKSPLGLGLLWLLLVTLGTRKWRLQLLSK